MMCIFFFSVWVLDVLLRNTTNEMNENKKYNKSKAKQNEKQDAGLSSVVW